MAEVIYRNAKKLQRLAEDILDVSKIESNSMNLKMERFNICDVVSSTISDFENGGIRGVGELLPSVKIIYRSKEQIPNYDPFIVESDKTRISQVLSNLLSNANKSSIGEAEGGIKFIRIDLKRIEEYNKDSLQDKKPNHNHKKQRFVVVSVRDQGSGINKELRRKLFEKFATGSYGGTGLGLFISKNIIESHGGKLWFEDNQDGKGVTFYFTLPLFNEQPLESFNDFQISSGQKNIKLKKNILSRFVHPAPSKSSNAKKILLVDDDFDVNITLKKVLEEKGYVVDAFSNPQNALKEYKKNTYDLVILDIKMPNMSGFELYEEIRKMDDKVKVCFLTAGEINPDNDRDIIINNLFLRKPIENDALLEAIENIKDP
jgi:CheY-like chemotaxis protein